MQSTMTSSDMYNMNSMEIKKAPQVTKVESKPAPPPQSSADKQPQSMKNFVQRCFSSCTNEAERLYMQGELSKITSKIASEGRTHIHKWDLEPTISIPDHISGASKKPSIYSSFTHLTHTNTNNNNNNNNNYGMYGLTLSEIQEAQQAEKDNQTGKKRKSRFANTENVTAPTQPSTSITTTTGIINTSSSTTSSLTELSSSRNNNSNSNNNKSKKSALAGVDELLTPEEIKKRERREKRFENDKSDSAVLASHSSSNNNNSIYSNNNPYSNNQSSDGMTSRYDNKKGNKKKMRSQHVQIPLNQSTSNLSESNVSEIDFESLRIVGTCTKLEKEYFRLTSAPHPSVVRPEPILVKALKALIKKWELDEIEYLPLCSQLKAIRQDLTVQHIHNDFTVHVYETHARIALESGDLNEYNQCQTQLKQLYASGLKGNEMEFIAYRILYYVNLLGNKKYQNGSSDLLFLMASLTPEALSDKAVDHALKIRHAIQLDNYHQFFQLYRNIPNMGVYILDLMMDTWRLNAIQRICKGFKPSISIEFIYNELAFDTMELCIEFLQKIGGIIVVNDPNKKNNDSNNKHHSKKVKEPITYKYHELNTKDTVIDPAGVFTQEKLLL